MSHYFMIVIVVAAGWTACNHRAGKQEMNTASLINTSMDTTKKIFRTEEEWKSILTPQEYHVLREKGTDAPFTGSLTFNKDEGTYYCAACGAELFTSDMKFESHCGWPSFDSEITGGRIVKSVDTSHGMVRTEITCAACGSHLGHLFDDGPTASGLRYCVNSTSLDFKKKD